MVPKCQPFRPTSCRRITPKFGSPPLSEHPASGPGSMCSDTHTRRCTEPPFPAVRRGVLTRLAGTRLLRLADAKRSLCSVLPLHHADGGPLRLGERSEPPNGLRVGRLGRLSPEPFRHLDGTVDEHAVGVSVAWFGWRGRGWLVRAWVATQLGLGTRLRSDSGAGELSPTDRGSGRGREVPLWCPPAGDRGRRNQV